jgi:hypothetical protein
MVRVRRWILRKRGKVVWSEPQLPPFVKINPNGVNPEMGLQPGDISMAMAAMEFLDQEEDEDLAELLAQMLPDDVQGGLYVLHRVRVGQPQVTLAVRAEGGAGQGRHAAVGEQPGRQFR